MLQKLGDHIANCLARADDDERRAAEAPTEALRIDHERRAKTWRHLARSYQVVESLERFLLDADKAKRVVPSAVETEVVSTFSLRSTAFGPEIIAVLTVAYDNAIKGQPVAVHEIIAKHIIELASEGERDPHKLSEGALALSAQSPGSTGS